MGNVYTLLSPTTPRSCAVFSSPHSGSDYSPEFLATSRLDSVAIRSSEDAFVDELFADAPKFGAYLLAAHAPRAFIDLNRRADELDPAIIRGAKRATGNARIAAGLGVIPRVVADGQVILTGKMPIEVAEERVERYYQPFHNTLSAVLQAQRETHGMAILFDCHSMPNRALEAAPLVGGRKPDVVLGDRFGAASDRWIVEATEQLFVDAGFTVARNAPFSGGYITQQYGRPRRNTHALQIEINRSLYMDEMRLVRRSDFEEFRQTLSDITNGLAKVGPVRTDIAAE